MHIKTSDQEKLPLGFYGTTCNWGIHICGLYEEKVEKDEIIFGLLKQGFLDKDINLYCPVERSKEVFKEEFTAYCPECGPHLEDPESFQILSPRDLYYPEGYFSPIKMDESLNTFFENSQKNGKRNVRATAEMSWVREANIQGTEMLMVYESRLNYFIPGKPWLSVCLYDVNRFSGSEIMNVLQTHPYAINKKVITQNPYYVEPDLWLKKNAPEYVGKSLTL